MDYRPITGAMHRLELMRRIRFRNMLGARGLHPGQPPLLEYIAQHPGCTQKDAASELDVSPASAATSLKRLEKSGLVCRRGDPSDARRNCLYLTAEGEKRRLASQVDFDALDARMFSGLSEAELAGFKALCDRMFDNLADESTRHLTICRLHRAAHGPLPDSKEEE